MDAIRVPAPSACIVIERQQLLLGERMQELDHKKWIARGLVQHQLRQRFDMRNLVMQRLGDQLLDVRLGQRCQRDLFDPAARSANGLELARQRVGDIHFVAAIGAHQHQVAHVRAGQQILQQVERCRVEPLQIVEKQGQRMLGPGKHTDKAPEHQKETPLCLLRVKGRNRWWFADDEFEFRDEVGHQPRIGIQRLLQRVTPVRQLRVVLAQQRAHQALKGLYQRRIRNVAPVLIELAGGENSARRHQHFVQFIDHRRLAYTGITGDQHQLRRTVFNDSPEGGNQRFDLALSPVEFLGHQQPIGRAVLTQRKVVDPAQVLPIRQASAQVMFQPCSGLIALLGGFGQ
ncbi:hypothetical protein D3C87_1177390 [compost metagenome]